MRYISIDHITEGMILGKPFYGRKGELLLQAGLALPDIIINRIKLLGYSGLYIEDAFSEGIEIKDVISDEVRRNVTQAVSRLMTNIETKTASAFCTDLDQIKKFLNQIIDEIMASDSSIVNIIDLKEFDLYTYQHSVNVCVLSCIIGTVLKYSRKDLYRLALAAILHDIGKLFINKEILNKPGKLTPEEFEIMKQHSKFGYDCLERKCHLPSVVMVSVLQHHERFNGTGYPNGSKGNEISQFSQIVSIADVYDAITSARPYREAILPSEAYEFIMGNSGHFFNPKIVDVFVKKVAPFPLGMHVQLSNGLTGYVYENYGDCIMRPLIKLDPIPGQTTERFINLKEDANAYNITIQKVL